MATGGRRLDGTGLWGAALLALAAVSAGCGPRAEQRDLSAFFGGREGSFVLYDSRDGRWLRHNPAGCARRASPCSTFKIPHTAVALETGVASGPDFALPWDGVKRDYQAWNADQTLRSALRNSVVWYYLELARRIGPEREADFVRRLGYGNMDANGGQGAFWIQGKLAISADEQVAFLRRLWAGELPLSPEAQRVTRELMELSRRDGRVLYGKTGTGEATPGGPPAVGWFVGCVSRDGHNAFFATRLGGSADATGKEARRITEEILEKLRL